MTVTGQAPARRLEGKRVLLVGGGQSAGQGVGIGRATALLYARHGAELVLVDRNEAAVQETRKMIEAEGGTASVILADVRSDDDCARMVRSAQGALGRIDVLFDGIGRQGRGTVDETTPELWDEVIGLNLTAMWLVVRHVLPVMQAQRAGSIVLVSSISAVRGGTAAAYGVSKAAVNRLAAAVAASAAQFDVRANAIMPGLLDTPMAIDGIVTAGGPSREDIVAQRQATVPMSIVGNAWDVAWAALYFASDESRYVSGQCLAVDAARTVS
jgi:NAD(P)-dependent dehydrogenase (short-subunit alcohol dehydrogenase family)